MFAVLLDPCDRENIKSSPWRKIFSNRDFALYLAPWLIFNIASGLASFVWLELPKLQVYTDAIAFGNMLHLIGPGVFGFFSGILADRWGRKQPIVIGLVLLGASFAFLGLATSPLSVFVYLVLSGIAWGALSVAFLAIPGDLSSSGSKEKFYAVGVVVPLTIYMSFSVLSEMIEIHVSPSVLSTTLSVILFVCIFPVLYAQETLSSSKIRERKMKEYVDKVGKLVEKSKKT